MHSLGDSTLYTPFAPAYISLHCFNSFLVAVIRLDFVKYASLGADGLLPVKFGPKSPKPACAVLIYMQNKSHISMTHDGSVIHQGCRRPVPIREVRRARHESGSFPFDNLTSPDLAAVRGIFNIGKRMPRW